jgi:hypothetical protein
MRLPDLDYRRADLGRARAAAVHRRRGRMQCCLRAAQSPWAPSRRVAPAEAAPGPCQALQPQGDRHQRVVLFDVDQVATEQDAGAGDLEIVAGRRAHFAGAQLDGSFIVGGASTGQCRRPAPRVEFIRPPFANPQAPTALPGGHRGSHDGIDMPRPARYVAVD